MQYAVLHVEPRDRRNFVAQEPCLLGQVREHTCFRHYSIPAGLPKGRSLFFVWVGDQISRCYSLFSPYAGQPQSFLY